MRVVELLEKPSPTFSFEFFPPKTEAGLEKLYATIEHLAELNPAYVSVTYGAGGSTRDRTIETTRHIRQGIGIETVVHLTCRGHDAAELTGILDAVSECGAHNVLALRGDPPRDAQAAGQDKGEFRYASDLVGFLRRRGGFCVGAACYPEGHVENPDKEDDLRRLKEKVDAGTDFLVTQLFFDNACYFGFVARARAAGIRVPIIPGIMPVTNVAQIERFTKMCGATIPDLLRARLDRVKDDEQAVMAVGIEWAIQQGRELLSGGAPGLHFYTLNRSLATRVVCRSLMP